MPVIPNTVSISGMIAPTGTTDTFPTHSDIYGSGGLRIVSSNSERNSISVARRRAGMIVGVNNGDSTFTYYQLNSGNWLMDDSDWAVWNIGAGINYQQVGFGDDNAKLTSSSNFLWDNTNKTLELIGNTTQNTDILRVIDSYHVPIMSIDTNRTFKLYNPESHSIGLSASNTLSEDLQFVLPTSLGNAGQLLITDGAGVLNWGDAIAQGNQGYSQTILADGLTTTWAINHNLKTLNVMIQVFDTITLKNIEVEIIRKDINNIIINSTPGLPLGTYTVLVASMVYTGLSSSSLGGSNSSIQFNQGNTLGGDTSFEYLYYLNNNSRIVQLTTPWGDQNLTTADYESYVGTKILTQLGRQWSLSSDLVQLPIVEGRLSLYSSKNNTTSIKKVDVYGNSDSSGAIDLFNQSGSIQVHISDSSYLLGNLMLGTSVEDDTKLKIKSSTNAIMVVDDSDTLNFTLDKEGNVSTNGWVKVGVYTDHTAAPAIKGTIIFDSTTNQFFGYNGTTWVILG